MALKILIVADHSDWVLGIWARNIIDCNDSLYDFYFVTRAVCFDDPDVFPELARRADLVFFMTPYFLELYPLPKSVPIISSIHHFVDSNHLQAAFQADLICYMADMWKPELLKCGIDAKRLSKLSAGVDSTIYCPALSNRPDRKRFGFGASEFVVGFFAKKSSNECDRKNRKAAFGIISRLSDETDKTVKLLLTGPGWESKDYCAIKGNVTYLPFVDPTFMPSVYRAIDVYLVTSTVEGGPVTLLEAMASGVPVVSTRCGFAPEVIEHGKNSFLVKDVVDDGVRYISKLMESEALRFEMGLKARRTIVKSRSWAQMASSFPEVVKRALDNYSKQDKPAYSRIAFAPYGRTYSDYWHWPNVAHEDPDIQQKATVAYDRYLWREQLFREGNRKLALKMAIREYLHNRENRIVLKQYFRMLKQLFV